MPLLKETVNSDSFFAMNVLKDEKGQDKLPSSTKFYIQLSTVGSGFSPSLVPTRDWGTAGGLELKKVDVPNYRYAIGPATVSLNKPATNPLNFQCHWMIKVN